jgi:hypothetical protein
MVALEADVVLIEEMPSGTEHPIFSPLILHFVSTVRHFLSLLPSSPPGTLEGG